MMKIHNDITGYKSVTFIVYFGGDYHNIIN